MNAAVSKTVMGGLRPSRVRIPPPPLTEPESLVVGSVTRLYLGGMASSRTVNRLAVAVCALGASALAFLASMWLLNPYPAGASCDTDHGYAEIKAHAEANSTLAPLFTLGVLPFLAIGFVSFAALIGSGLYCQN